MDFENLCDLWPLLQTAPIENFTTDCFYTYNLPMFFELMEMSKDNFKGQQGDHRFNQIAFRCCDLEEVNFFSDDYYDQAMPNVTRVFAAIYYTHHLELVAINWGASLTYLDVDLSLIFGLPPLTYILERLLPAKQLQDLRISLWNVSETKLVVTRKYQAMPRLESVKKVQFGFVVDPHSILGKLESFGGIWV